MSFLFYSKPKTICISDTDSEFEMKTNHMKRPLTDSDDDFSPKRKPAQTCKYKLNSSTITHLNTKIDRNCILRFWSKHTPSLIKTSQLMLHTEIITVCSKIHVKHINTLYVQNIKEYLDFAGCTSYLCKVHSSYVMAIFIVSIYVQFQWKKYLQMQCLIHL